MPSHIQISSHELLTFTWSLPETMPFCAVLEQKWQESLNVQRIMLYFPMYIHFHRHLGHSLFLIYEMFSCISMRSFRIFTLALIYSYISCLSCCIIIYCIVMASTCVYPICSCFLLAFGQRNESLLSIFHANDSCISVYVSASTLRSSLPILCFCYHHFIWLHSFIIYVFITWWSLLLFSVRFACTISAKQRHVECHLTSLCLLRFLLPLLSLLPDVLVCSAN